MITQLVQWKGYVSSFILGGLVTGMKILLFGGFLGSGKTSILIQLAKYIVSQKKTNDDAKVVIIENEIGDVGVDDKLVRSQGLAVQNLFSGCACCTSSGYLLSDIRKIQNEMAPDWIIIEATGVAYPREIKESVEMNLHVPVRIMAVADAFRWKRLMNAMSGIIVSQLDSADIVLLNKIDLVNDETADEIVEDLRSISKDATIYLTSGINPIDIDVWRSIT